MTLASLAITQRTHARLGRPAVLLSLSRALLAVPLISARNTVLSYGPSSGKGLALWVGVVR